MWSWQIDMAQGNPLSADARAFVKRVRPQIRRNLKKRDSFSQWGRSSLLLRSSFEKTSPIAEMYIDPAHRHKQEAALQAGEIDEALKEASIKSWRRTRNGPYETLGRRWMESKCSG